MNGLQLRCGGLDSGTYGGHIEAGEEQQGDLRGEENCKMKNGVRKYMTVFSLQVEGRQVNF